MKKQEIKEQLKSQWLDYDLKLDEEIERDDIYYIITHSGLYFDVEVIGGHIGNDSYLVAMYWDETIKQPVIVDNDFPDWFPNLEAMVSYCKLVSNRANDIRKRLETCDPVLSDRDIEIKKAIEDKEYGWEARKFCWSVGFKPEFIRKVDDSLWQVKGYVEINKQGEKEAYQRTYEVAETEDGKYNNGQYDVKVLG